MSTIGDVVQKYSDFAGKKGRMATMAVVLAREVFFGEELMSKCTTKGYGDRPRLPVTELIKLKKEIYRLYPNFWNNPVAFEERWTKCCEAISQACKRARRKEAMRGKIHQ